MNEAELLFTQILDCKRADLYLNRDLPLAKDKMALVSSVLRKRCCGEPLQYILGKTEFMGWEFRVDKSVLIPRPETEILVETAVKIAPQLNVLDLGTGSGCIAVSLAKLLPNVKVTATDISLEALETARYNASLNNVEVRFLQGDLFSNYDLRPKAYDLIISNPPYVPTAEIDDLQPEVREEPVIALDGGEDGLDFYRRIINQAPLYLKAGGYLILEMGFGQAEAIREIFKFFVNFEIIEIIKDYSNIDRVIVAKKIS